MSTKCGEIRVSCLFVGQFIKNGEEMTNHKKMFIALAVVLAAGIGAVFYARGDHKTKEVQYLSASWDYSYRDVEEIARASDRIALVSVGNVEILVFCKENADGTYRILGGPQGRLVYDDGTLNSISTVLAQ